jgi:hypothetical protein
LVKSHIIPDFLLKQVEEQIPTGKHSQSQPHLSLIDWETTGRIYCKQKGNVLMQEGFKEYLLCEDCEKILKVGEDYAKECLYGRGPIRKHTQPYRSHRRYRYVTQRKQVIREGLDMRWVDYEKFKQFQIGTIWRACVANGNAFKNVQATAATTEQMRLGLLSGKLDECLVPCAMEFLDGLTSENFGVVSFPFEHNKIVRFIMGGYQWHFFMDGNAPTEIILRKNGYMIIKVLDIARLYTPDDMLQTSAY